MLAQTWLLLLNSMELKLGLLLLQQDILAPRLLTSRSGRTRSRCKFCKLPLYGRTDLFRPANQCPFSLLSLKHQVHNKRYRASLRCPPPRQSRTCDKRWQYHFSEFREWKHYFETREGRWRQLRPSCEQECSEYGRQASELGLEGSRDRCRDRSCMCLDVCAQLSRTEKLWVAWIHENGDDQRCRI